MSALRPYSKLTSGPNQCLCAELEAFSSARCTDEGGCSFAQAAYAAAKVSCIELMGAIAVFRRRHHSTHCSPVVNEHLYTEDSVEFHI